MEAGKHVLCEKPIALSAAEAAELIEVRERTGRHVAEAFMVRHHPQWQLAREIARSGRLGEVRAIQTFFSYHLTDPSNIRNQADIGGGGLYDIGCYAILTARYIFGAEPLRAIGLMDRDPALQDRPADQRPGGIPGRTAADLHLLDPARAAPAGSDRGHEGARRGADPVQPET